MTRRLIGHAVVARAFARDMSPVRRTAGITSSWLA